MNWSAWKTPEECQHKGGLPVLFQGSHQGCLLNNQLIHCDGSNGKPIVTLTCCQAKQEAFVHPTRCEATELHPSNLNRPQPIASRPSKPSTSPTSLSFHPDTHLTTELPPSTDRRAGCHLNHHHVVPNQLKGVDILRGSNMSAKQSNPGAHTPR